MRYSHDPVSGFGEGVSFTVLVYICIAHISLAASVFVTFHICIEFLFFETGSIINLQVALLIVSRQYSW